MLRKTKIISSRKRDKRACGSVCGGVCGSRFILLCEFSFRVNLIRVWVDKKTILTLFNVFFNSKNVSELARANSKTQHEHVLSKCFTITKPKRKKSKFLQRAKVIVTIQKKNYFKATTNEIKLLTKC